MTAMRLGLQRGLRKICREFRRGDSAFDGCLGRGQGPVDGPLGGREFAAWGRRFAW